MTGGSADRLGGFRIGDHVYPIVRVGLDKGAVHLRVRIPGPVRLRAGQWVMVYDPDGVLVVRGRWRVDLDAGPDDVYLLSYHLSCVDKLTIAERGPPPPLVGGCTTS